MADSHTDVSMKAVINKILAVTGVTAIVGTRVNIPSPTDKTFPHVVVTKLNDSPSHGLGFNKPASVLGRVQVEGHCETYAEALDLMSAIESGLDGATVAMSGWGTVRLEGIGIPVRDYEVGNKTLYMGARRYKFLMAGTNVS